MARSTDTRERARRRELAGQDERALELYETALRESRSARDAGTDPGLCVRVADVHSRLGQTGRALDLYREAVDLYVDQGLIPNALSVLERLLGLYPDRVELRRRMVELQLEMGQVGDARTHLLRYLEVLRERGDGERAEEALTTFGQRFGPDDILRGRARALVDEAHERTFEPPPEPEPVTEPGGSEGAEAGDEGTAADEARVEGSTPEPPSGVAEETEAADEADAPDARDEIPDLAELRGRDEPLRDILEGEPPGGPGAGELGERLAEREDEDAAAPARQEGGETGVLELPEERNLSGISGDDIALPEEGELGVRAELEQGLEILDDLLELAPDRLELHRRKVAYARRLGDEERLEEAYLALATGLSEASTRGARLLFERVLELDPDNSRALSGLARLDASELEDKKSRGEDAAAGNHPPRMTEASDHQTRQELGEVLWAEFEESVRQLPWLDGATQTFQAAGSEFLPPLAAFEMLGRYLLAREKYERAARVLSLAVEVEEYSDEDLVDVLFHLARACERLGREEEARRMRERVAEADPDFASILAMVPGEAEGSEEEDASG